MEKEIVIVVHSGSFHTDDVFAVASLLCLFDEKMVKVRVVRSRSPEVIETGDFVVDVGSVYDPDRNRFDHHQIGGAGERDNGIPYAAFGLVWKKLGTQISGSDEAALMIDETLVQPVDYGDNLGLSLQELAPGIYPYTLDRLVSVFGSTHEESGQNEDEIFFQLVVFAKKVLNREVQWSKSFVSARPDVERAYRESSDKRIIVLDKDYPWYRALSKYPEPIFVVSPDSVSGQWEISTVRQGLHDFRNRKDFPRSWAGKRGAELIEICGVADAIFCHDRLFFAVAGSKEGAVALATKALAQA